MKRVSIIIALLIAVAVLTVTAGNLQAAGGKSTIQPLCTQCHKAENNVIWGTVVPGSQLSNDGLFKLQSGDAIWDIRYDRNTKMKNLRTAKELPDDEGVKVKLSLIEGRQVYAEELSYKPNYTFMDPEDIISIDEVLNLLKRKPKDGDWMLFDSRGYDNYIEGHLPNAVLLPYYELSAYKDRLPKDKNTLIVSYCRGGT